MIVYDMIRVVIVKYKHSQYLHSFIYDHIEDKHRGMLPLVSFTNRLAKGSQKNLIKKTNIFVKFQKKNNAQLKSYSV